MSGEIISPLQFSESFDRNGIMSSLKTFVELTSEAS